MEVYTFLEQDFLQMDKKAQQKIGKIYFIINIIIIITVYILLICHGNAPSATDRCTNGSLRSRWTGQHATEPRRREQRRPGSKGNPG
jgi:hypothetical protein